MIKILTLILLIAGLVIGVYLIGQQTGFFSKANISDAPSQVRISNISDNSFTISWITAAAVPGFIQYGEGDSLLNTALDDRDKGGNNARFTHHVTLKNLNPSTIYSFKIGSGKGVYDNQGKLYTQTTAPTANDTPPLADPIIGKVVKQDGAVSSDTLVYIQIEKATSLSSYSREDGNFLITLTNARTDNLSNYLTYDEKRKMQIVALSSEGVAQLDITGIDRSLPQKLTLQKSAEKLTWPADYNGDGVINSMDFAVYLKKKANL